MLHHTHGLSARGKGGRGSIPRGDEVIGVIKHLQGPGPMDSSDEVICVTFRPSRIRSLTRGVSVFSITELREKVLKVGTVRSESPRFLDRDPPGFGGFRDKSVHAAMKMDSHHAIPFQHA